MKYYPLRKGIGKVLEKLFVTNVHRTVDTAYYLRTAQSVVWPTCSLFSESAF